MNEYDSSKMADLLNAANGYELTEEPEEADSKVGVPGFFSLYCNNQLTLSYYWAQLNPSKGKEHSYSKYALTETPLACNYSN